MDSSNIMQIKIFSPYETFYEGETFSFSAQNASGPFDILYDHTNFICLLLAGTVKLNTPYGKKHFDLSKGILKVSNNNIVVFANV